MIPVRQSKERAKNKLFGAVYSHTAIILLLILLQIGIMVLTFTYLGNYSTYMNGVMSLLSFITAIYIFNEKGNPAFKMTWILFVFLVPVVGVGFYLFTKQDRNQISGCQTGEASSGD